MGATLIAPTRGTQVLLDAFLVWVQREGPQVSDRTATRYAKYAAQFCAQFGSPITCTERTLEAWRASINTAKDRTGTVKDASPSTVNVKLAAIRAFFDYLVATGRRRDNPAKLFSMQEVPRRKPRDLKVPIIKKLFEALYAAEPTEAVLQDRALLETLYGSGLRREEAAMLRLSQLVSRDMLQVVGKGDKERLTMVTEPEYEALRAWCLRKLGDARTATLRAEISDDAAFDDLRRRFPETYAFYSATGRPLAEMADPGHYVRARAVYWLRQIGETGATTHQFRHSFVTHLLDGGADLLMVGEMAGHNDINTTRGYRGIGRETLARALHAHPRG